MANMFSKPQVVQQAAPTPAPPPTMPDLFSPATMEAKRRAQQEAGRGGRTSTILSTAASRAGNTFAGQKLGSA